ncbi:MAG: fructose-specific PTS transporter subunit EIIC [Miniphocaeibacter sp.]|uniref:PTS sugar transporter subunit IIA n=1 Tax=Miniphocaeibacter halophilus TaxID=2931922 RepID=A0AC61MRN5_9FIRM|nr:fructose-specific PTS transporter subunit EIIC [Miniphocaeibacter halophilus]QQK08166.1 PTS sugar transporter subunit IIA [Miniphocaeibacter halophilus]
MEIRDLLKKDLIIMNLKSSTKESVIDEMIDQLYLYNIISNKEVFKNEIMNREKASSTALGKGVAMPHAKTSVVNTPAVVFAKSDNGLDFESLDGELSYLFFMIAAPAGANETHIETLAKLSKLILKEDFVEKLKNAKTPEEVLKIIDEEQEEKAKTEQTIEDRNKPFIVAVTACPTGIAHTYMAQEALEEKAEKLGVNIKVETNGSDGVKNKLTKEDINKAIGVIVSADTKVETNRFSGKKVIETPVSEAINKPERLINKILEGNIPIYKKSQSQSEDEDSKKDQGIGSRIYKDIMNGVSHMLPFVVGGGILMALSFLFERTLGNQSTPFIFLNTLGGNAFNFLLPILAGYIAYSIADRPALMPGMVAGIMASSGFSFIEAAENQAGAGFLGALVGGFVAGYSILLLKKMTSKMPKSFEGLKPMLIYPVLGLLLTGFVMYIAVNPVFVVINNAVNTFLKGLGTTNKVLLGVLLGGMMAVDMGGPVNKASYVFSTGVLATIGDGTFMASSMAGGMVPPLGIALASTIFFRNKFTEKEKQSGFTNYFLGLSFITEGAIPFAAADPLRVIGSSIVGSAVAGGLTQLFGISSPAPHGGIFVVPVMDSAMKALLFIASVLIGAVITGLIYGAAKKRNNE